MHNITINHLSHKIMTNTVQHLKSTWWIFFM